MELSPPITGDERRGAGLSTGPLPSPRMVIVTVTVPEPTVRTSGCVEVGGVPAYSGGGVMVIVMESVSVPPWSSVIVRVTV